MGRRSGFGGLLNAIARDAARAHRASIAEANRAARDQQRREREYARSVRAHQRDAKRQYLEDQLESAVEQTTTIAATIAELDAVLSHTLRVDDLISFNSLRVSEDYPPFQPPVPLTRQASEPQHTTYTSHIEPPGFLENLFPGARTRYAEKLQAAENEYQRALAHHLSMEQRRIAELEAARTAYGAKRRVAVQQAAERNAEVAEFQSAYVAGDKEAVIAYNAMVLDRSQYPEGLPQAFRLAYQSQSRELVVDYELPSVDVIPSAAEIRYVKGKDVFEEKPRKPAEIRERYQKLVACVALRTIHEVFEADQARHLDVVTFSGFVNAIDPATGQDIRPYLISVRASRAELEKIDLSRVDPRVCLRNLGASVSARADELLPVKPIIEFDMVDARFVEQNDVLGQLDARPNIMDLTPFEFEHLVGNVFAKMGLETKLTRSSRDGGVDVIAYDQRPILGGRVVIQAKRYRNTVGVSAVRDLYGTMMNEGANKGILVTTSGYGPDAFTFARDKPIELIDGGGLLFLCEQVGVKARIVMPAE